MRAIPNISQNLKQLETSIRNYFINPYSMVINTMTCRADYLDWEVEKGRFFTLCHNEIRGFTTSQLSQVCHDVRMVPRLKPLTGKIYHCSTSNTTEDASIDVSSENFGFVDSYNSEI